MPKNFKTLVRERMSKTHESWATAAGFVRRNAAPERAAACPICALTVEKVAALSEEQASKLYLSSRPADWCMDHVLISLELRRRNAFGKPLLTAMVEAKLRLSEELFDGSTEEGEDEAEDENGPLAPFDGRTMTLAEAKQWADLVNVQGQLQAADGKMRMRVWLGEHEATAEGSDLGTVQARAWSALRRKIEAGDR